jgi:hypothetical protein
MGGGSTYVTLRIGRIFLVYVQGSLPLSTFQLQLQRMQLIQKARFKKKRVTLHTRVRCEVRQLGGENNQFRHNRASNV